MTAELEHANITVANPDATAGWMADVFGWHIRWAGPARDGGRSVHVGSKHSYLALFAPAGGTGAASQDSYATRAGLNHLAIVVADLDATETAVRKAGFTPQDHADYTPGRRFYFHDDNGLEYEVVQYG